jgi:hypothetical protein
MTDNHASDSGRCNHVTGLEPCSQLTPETLGDLGVLEHQRAL